MTTTATTTATRCAAALTTLAGAVTGVVALGAPAHATHTGAYVGDRGSAIASDRNVNVRGAGHGRQVVTREAARRAYAAGGRVVWETADGRILTRDLETTVALEPAPGVDRQQLLGLREVGRSTIAIIAEERDPAPGDSYANYRTNLVAFDVSSGDRTVLHRNLNSFEAGYANAHVLADGSVVVSQTASVATFVERYSAEGTRLWRRKVAADSIAELAVIGDRITVVRSRVRGGDTIARIVRLDPATGSRVGARSVRVPRAGTALFCTDWRGPQRLVCQTTNGPVVVDTNGSDSGIVNRITAPDDAFVSVIGGR